jgi:hypothetical protein
MTGTQRFRHCRLIQGEEGVREEVACAAVEYEASEGGILADVARWRGKIVCTEGGSPHSVVMVLIIHSSPLMPTAVP